MYFTTKVCIGESFYSWVNVFEINHQISVHTYKHFFGNASLIWQGSIKFLKGFSVACMMKLLLKAKATICSGIFDCEFDLALRVQLWFLFPVLKLSNSTFFKRRKKLIWMGVSNNSTVTEWILSCQWHAMIYLGTFSLNWFLLILQ